MSENLDINLTVAAWADITIQNWLARIIALNIIDTKQLYDSFKVSITKNAHGDPALIEFAFLYYGKFVDMGVGRGNLAGDPGKKKKPKEWYYHVLRKEINKLKSILIEKYADKAAIAVTDPISNESLKLGIV